MPSANVNGTRLHYDDTGSGPAVVLLHGHTLDGRMWVPQVAVLKRYHRVLTYDLRGFGRSDVPTEGVPYSHAEDLRALVEHLHAGPAHLVGLSLGASVAVEAAIHSPALVRSLTLIDASAVAGFPWPAQLSEMFAGVHATAKSGDMAAAKAQWASVEWFAPSRAKPQVAAFVDEMLADYSGWHFVHRNPVKKFDPPANDRLGEIAVPTLVIVGELDLAYYNIPLAERLRDAIPGARLVVLPGVGHLASLEAPEAVNALLTEFLA